jgi:hypothetical protein
MIVRAIIVLASVLGLAIGLIGAALLLVIVLAALAS